MSVDATGMLTPQAIAEITCTVCGAPPGEECVLDKWDDEDDVEWDTHITRLEAYREGVPTRRLPLPLKAVFGEGQGTDTPAASVPVRKEATDRTEIRDEIRRFLGFLRDPSIHEISFEQTAQHDDPDELVSRYEAWLKSGEVEPGHAKDDELERFAVRVCTAMSTLVDRRIRMAKDNGCGFIEVENVLHAASLANPFEVFDDTKVRQALDALRMRLK